MSEQELNSYRFTSGIEPSDEMLECIMKEVAEDAMARRNVAEARLKESVNKERLALKKKWSDKIRSLQ